MANIAANDKRHKQDVKKHVMNRSQLSAVKTQDKKTRASRSQADLYVFYKMVDNIVSKKIIHKNKGNNWKSKVARALNEGTPSPAPAPKKKPVVKKVEVKKVEPKKEVKKPEKKPVVERKVSEESLKREQEQLKVVETKPAEKGPTGKAAPIKEAEKTSIIMISISPDETEAFLNDEEKNVLFYKVTPVNEVKRVLIYSTAPVQGVVGEFDLDSIEIKAPSTIWNKYSSKSVITKKEFDKYFEGKEKAHVLVSQKAFWYSKPKPLSDFNMKKGPSGFQYLK